MISIIYFYPLQCNLYTLIKFIDIPLLVPHYIPLLENLLQKIIKCYSTLNNIIYHTAGIYIPLINTVTDFFEVT